MEISGLCDPGAYPEDDTHNVIADRCGMCFNGRLPGTTRSGWRANAYRRRFDGAHVRLSPPASLQAAAQARKPKNTSSEYSVQSLHIALIIASIFLWVFSLAWTGSLHLLDDPLCANVSETPTPQ